MFFCIYFPKAFVAVSIANIASSTSAALIILMDFVFGWILFQMNIHASSTNDTRQKNEIISANILALYPILTGQVKLKAPILT